MPSAAYQRKWKSDHPDKQVAYTRKWREENPLADKEHYLKNQDYYKAKRRAHYIKNKDWFRKNHLKLKFGITLEDYNRLFDEQSGCCRICGTHQSQLKKTLSIDHCHKTGKIRALLCQKCNQGIGMFHEDLETMQSAIEYIKQHRQ
jgi:hypothetical protein